MTDNQTQTTPQKFPLTDKEKANISSRKAVVEQHNYIARLADSDLQSYILNVVGPRYGIPKGSMIRISEDLEYLEVMEAPKAPENPPVGSGTPGPSVPTDKVVAADIPKVELK